MINGGGQSVGGGRYHIDCVVEVSDIDARIVGSNSRSYGCAAYSDGGRNFVGGGVDYRQRAGVRVGHIKVLAIGADCSQGGAVSHSDGSGNCVGGSVDDRDSAGIQIGIDDIDLGAIERHDQAHRTIEAGNRRHQIVSSGVNYRDRIAHIIGDIYVRILGKH